MDRNDAIPILAQVDCLFLDGTQAMLQQAAELADAGKQVLIAVSQSFLPTDIVSMYINDASIAPAVRKKNAEAFCEKKGLACYMV